MAESSPEIEDIGDEMSSASAAEDSSPMNWKRGKGMKRSRSSSVESDSSQNSASSVKSSKVACLSSNGQKEEGSTGLSRKQVSDQSLSSVTPCALTPELFWRLQSVTIRRQAQFRLVQSAQRQVAMRQN